MGSSAGGGYKWVPFGSNIFKHVFQERRHVPSGVQEAWGPTGDSQPAGRSMQEPRDVVLGLTGATPHDNRSPPVLHLAMLGIDL